MDWAFVPLIHSGISATVNEEAGLFMQAVFTGMILFALYDVLRVFRRVFIHGIVLVSVEDVMYWIFCAMYMFGIILKENSGGIRCFFVAGVMFGAVVYYFGLSRYVVGFVSGIIKRILDVVSKVLKTLFSPLNRIVIFCEKKAKKRILKYKQSIKNRKKTIEKP